MTGCSLFRACSCLTWLSDEFTRSKALKERVARIADIDEDRPDGQVEAEGAAGGGEEPEMEEDAEREVMSFEVDPKLVGG